MSEQVYLGTFITIMVAKNIGKLYRIVNSFKIARQKRYIQEEAQLEKIQQHSNINQQNYSCLFKGNELEENKKRHSKQILEQGKKNVKHFLKSFNFHMQLNNEHINEYFYNYNKIPYINLEEILDITRNFYSISSDLSLKILNERIQYLFILLINYFYGLFHIQDQLEEYNFYFEEIYNFLYQQIEKIGRAVKKYQKLIAPLEEYIKQDQNFIFKIEKTQLKQVPSQIKIFFDKLLSKYNEHIKNNFAFQLNDLIYNTYLNRVTHKYLIYIKLYLANYSIIDQEIYEKDFKTRIESLFLQFFQEKQLKTGICESEINEQLQFLIYSIDWMQQKDTLVEEVQFLLTNISLYHFNVCKYQTSIFKPSNFTKQTLYNLKNKLTQCDISKSWWEENISEYQNVIIIFQLFILTVQIHFKKNALYLNNYDLIKRKMIILILRKMNNGHYNYYNFSILQICEMILQQLRTLIFKSIVEKNGLFLQEQKSTIQIVYKGQLIDINIEGDQQSTLLKFFQENQLFYKYFLINQEQNSRIFNKQQKIFAKKFQFLNNNKQLEIPKIYFELISETENNSNIITLVIAGFITKHQNKKQYWKKLLIQGQGTVIALHWDTNDLNGFLNINSIQQLANENPYLIAYNEAIKVGEYLGYLIGKIKIFGNHQINLIVHSLGSVILCSCIEILDKLQSQVINQIIMMGGAIDVRKLSIRRWNSVTGKIHNVYIQNDKILRHLLKFITKYNEPIGLQSIYLDYEKVYNHDLSGYVIDHCDYTQKLDLILLQTNFNNEIDSLIPEF